MKFTCALLNSSTLKKQSFIFLMLILAQNTLAQMPSLQDPSLNNLVHPAGYKTGEIGKLGSVEKSGNGKQAMILVPGLGFGADVFERFIKQYKNKYRIYTITPAGFAGTPAPPMPDTSVKYNELSWTNGIETGILALIEKEKLDKPVIIAHFVTATQVALNLALDHPDKISKIIIIGGSPYRYYPGQKKDGTFSDWENEKKYTPEQREKVLDLYWAPRWFKTVTKKTWDNNMWTPDDYCKDSIMGKELFRKSAEVPIQIMIRYLIEWMAYDANEKYKNIKVPALILIPDFKGILANDPNDTTSGKSPVAKLYLNYFHKDIWITAKQSGNPMLQFETIPDTRIFMWYDNPKATCKTINDFLKQQ